MTSRSYSPTPFKFDPPVRAEIAQRLNEDQIAELEHWVSIARAMAENPYPGVKSVKAVLQKADRHASALAEILGGMDEEVKTLLALEFSPEWLDDYNIKTSSLAAFLKNTVQQYQKGIRDPPQDFLAWHVYEIMKQAGPEPTNYKGGPFDRIVQLSLRSIEIDRTEPGTNWLKNLPPKRVNPG